MAVVEAWREHGPCSKGMPGMAANVKLLEQHCRFVPTYFCYVRQQIGRFELVG